MSKTKAVPRIPAPSAPLRIVVVAFDGISPFHLAVPCLVFGEDRRELGIPRASFQVCAAETGALRTSAGFAIKTRHGLGVLRRADVIIVPSWRDVAERPPRQLLAALRDARQRGAKLVGLCLGAFVLAEAGLLEGKAATTHWHWAAAFAERFPGVRLNPAVLYVDEGSVITSAGTAASLDCCLHLVRQWHGAEAANRLARRLVIAPHRRGGQAQFIEQPLPQSGHDLRMQDLLTWMVENLHKDQNLESLARRVAMSRRTFTRRFQKTTGTTVLRWLAHQRLSLASRLLETTDRSIDSVATGTGFGSTLSLRKHFAATFGLPPGAYRKQFRARPEPG